MSELILASASPRRKELLNQVGYTHSVCPSFAEERTTKTAPDEMVEELSIGKALDVAKNCQEKGDITVIGADTVVSYKGQVLGKPKDKEDAYRMLLLLQGEVHQVYTGVTIAQRIDGVLRHKTFSECTDVTLYSMTEDEINAYIETQEPMDKAGAYGIQGRFAVYVKAISGDYNNVVGLPVARLHQELKRL